MHCPGSNPARTALLVIDLQIDFCSDDGALAALGSDVSPCRAVANRIAGFLPTIRADVALTAFFRLIYDPEKMSESQRERLIRNGRPIICAPESAGSELFIKPVPGDLVFTKHRYSAFSNDQVCRLLHERSITTVAVVGVDTHICVEGTVRQGYDLGYRMIVRAFIDFSRPVGLLMFAMLAASPMPATRPRSRRGAARAPGGYLAVSSVRMPGPEHPRDAEKASEVQKLFNETLGTGLWREDGEILAWFGDWEYLEPGLVPLPEWRPDAADQGQEAGLHLPRVRRRCRPETAAPGQFLKPGGARPASNTCWLDDKYVIALTSMTTTDRRTQQQRRDQAEAALLNAAAELVVEQGVHSLTLARVGERPGTVAGSSHYSGPSRRSCSALPTRPRAGSCPGSTACHPALTGSCG